MTGIDYLEVGKVSKEASVAGRNTSLRKWQVYVTLATLISGILLVTSLEGYAGSPRGKSESQNADLVLLITNLEKESSQLEQEIDFLHSEIASFQFSKVGGETQLDILQLGLNNLRQQAGLLPVAGPGIIIILDDNEDGARVARNSNPIQYNPEHFIVHDKNILYFISELRLAGAESISVNGQRVIDSTPIHCVGSVVMVNATRMAPPYEIKAIGQPEQLEAAILAGLEFPYLKDNGFPVKLSRMKTVELPAYKGGYSLAYSRAPEEEIMEGLVESFSGNTLPLY